VSKLRLNWSPEQIAGWLKRAHPEDECYHVSHETIYRSLFVKHAACLRKSCLAIFDRSGRSVDLSGRTRMAIDGGKSRISSQSVRDRQRLKIGRDLVLGMEVRVLPSPSFEPEDFPETAEKPAIGGLLRLRFSLRGDRFWPECDFGRSVSGPRNIVSPMQIRRW